MSRLWREYGYLPIAALILTTHFGLQTGSCVGGIAFVILVVGLFTWGFVMAIRG